MKHSTIIAIRNYVHPYAMLVLFYWIGNLLNISYEMTREDSLSTTIMQMLLLSLFAGGSFSMILAAVYEVPYKLWTFKEPADVWDIYRSGFGGVLGFGLVCVFPNIPNWIVYTNLGIVAVLFIADLLRSLGVIQKIILKFKK